MFNIFKSAPKNYDDLDGKSFKLQFNSTPNAELIDVRTAGEFSTGTIKGARNLDITSGQVHSAAKTLDRNKEYFLFCRSGNRSGMACQLLADQGFKVHNLNGGISSWPSN